MTNVTTPPEVIDLLQQMIRNKCVNDGSVESGEETRNADLLESFFAGSGIDFERRESAPGRDNLIARIEGSTRTRRRSCSSDTRTSSPSTSRDGDAIRSAASSSTARSGDAARSTCST